MEKILIPIFDRIKDYLDAIDENKFSLHRVKKKQKGIIIEI